MRISDNKGNVTNFGIINNTIQNNVELTLEQKMEIKTSFKEFIKAIFGKLTYKFIGNYKLEKVLFEKYIIAQIDNIDTKKIVEPRLSVVGPTIENLKYNMTEEQIRKMYENILIGELNEDIHSKILPAYIEIVKQLSKEDAVFLKSLKDTKKQQLSLLYVRLKNTTDSGYIEVEKIIVVHNNNNVGHTIKPNKIVLENLERLNIIKTNDDITLNGEETSVKNAFDYYRSHFDESLLQKDLTLGYDIGMLEITEFGKNFIDICCS